MLAFDGVARVATSHFFVPSRQQVCTEVCNEGHRETSLGRRGVDRYSKSCNQHRLAVRQFDTTQFDYTQFDNTQFDYTVAPFEELDSVS